MMIPRYAPPDMAALFSDAARFSLWLEVELLATEAQAALGVVPADDAATCRAKAPTVDDAVRGRGARAREGHRPRRGRLRRRGAGAHRRAGRLAHPLRADLLRRGGHRAVRHAHPGGRPAAGRPRCLRGRAQGRGPSSCCTCPSPGAPTACTPSPRPSGPSSPCGPCRPTATAAACGPPATGSPWASSRAPSGTYSNIDPAVEASVCAALGLTPVPATQVIARDRHAEYLVRLRLDRGDRRAHVHRDPAPGPQRGGRGGGALRRRAEGQLGHAAQAQPHPLRAAVRPGPPVARLPRRRAGGRGAVARARHLAQLGRAGGPARRVHAGLLHAAQGDRAGRRPGDPPRAGAGQPHRGLARARLLPVRPAGAGRGRPDAATRPTGSSSATPGRPGRNGAPCAPCSRTIRR